jgi:histone-lysine N-methyltransferase SETMAR
VQPAEIHQRLAAQPCKDLYSKRSIGWWCAQLVCGREGIEDDYRSGSPPIVHLGTRILARLESESFQSAYSLVEVLGVSQATVLNRLHNSLVMKNFHVRWVPHQLTSELQATIQAKCRGLLPILKALPENNFHKVVTGDKSRFYLETGHSAGWSVCRDVVATKTKPTITTLKCMLVVMWGRKGFCIVDLMTWQNQFNSQSFLEHITVPLVQETFPHGRNRRALRLHLDLDNSRGHFSKVGEQFCEANDILPIPHPPSSPDLAPSDSWLFGRIQTALAGPNSMKQSNFWTQSADCWTQYRSKNSMRFLTNGWRG